MAVVTENEYPEWTSTSAKRKRVLAATANALHTPLPLASGLVTLPTLEPPTKKAKAYGKKEKKEDFVNINWEERKDQLKNYSNKAYIDIIMTEVLAIFNDMALEFRKDASQTGPTMLWHLLPAFMEAIQKTPWGWFDVVRKDPEETVEGPLVMFINYTYGDRGQDLTESQNKFRFVIMGKVKTAVTAYLRKFFTSEEIQVAYSNVFFNGKE
jgi:hypothetical protein